MEKLHDKLKEFITPHRWEIMKQVLSERTKHLTVVLEDFYQPHNFSAVLRSCDCFGIQDVHIVENKNKYKTNPHVNMGADKWLTIHRYNEPDKNNTDVCFKKLKTAGFQVIAAHPHETDTTLFDLDISKPTAIVFGTEKEGISNYVKNNVDGFMRIPMYGFTESFNVSVSAALTLNHLKHKLKESSINWELNSKDALELFDHWLQLNVKGYELIKKQHILEENHSEDQDS